MPMASTAKKPIRLFALAAAGLIALALSGCDSQSGPSPTAGSDARQVTVVGEGQVQGTPDTLTANVSIQFSAPDVTGAMNQTSERQQAVIDALVDAGVERKDISTTQVSLQPQYSGDANNTIVGYLASNSIDVKIRALDSASQLVKDARARAFEDAKDRAQQYAQLSGLDLGNVISISEASGPTPPPQPPIPMRAEAAMAVPLEPGQQNVGFTVTVIWELK
jgi:uncharacterized protein